MDGLGTVSETARPAALGGARRGAQHLRARGRAARPARARAPPARRRGPRRRGGHRPAARGRRRARGGDARISTVYDGGGRQRSAGPRALAAGRGLPAARLRAGDRRLVARPRGPPGARGGVPLAPRRPRGHRRLRADASHASRRPPREGRPDLRLRRRAHHAAPGGLPRLSGGVRRLARGARQGDGPRRRGARRPPAVRARARRDHGDGVPRPDRARTSRTASTSPGCARSTSSASTPTAR